MPQYQPPSRKDWVDLIAQYSNATTVDAYVDLQERLASEILRAERARKENRKARYIKDVIRRLRFIADAIAWDLLHPHVIRHTSAGTGRPPSLLDQGKSFQEVVRSLRSVAEKFKVPPIICDLTNCVKIGDIVMPANGGDSIAVIECKLGMTTGSSMQGPRQRRQMKKIELVQDYLTSGEGKTSPSGPVRKCIELPTYGRQHNLQVVDRCINTAIDQGSATASIRDDAEWVVAVRNDQRPLNETLPPIPKKLSSPQSLCVGAFFHTPQEQQILVVFPYLCLKLSLEAKIAVFMRDVTVMHCADWFALKDISTLHGKICKFELHSKNPWDSGICVETPNGCTVLSTNFFLPWMYEFITAESVVTEMSLFVRQFIQGEGTVS